MKKFRSTLAEKSALRKWDKLCNTIYSTSVDTFGKKTYKTTEKLFMRIEFSTMFGQVCPLWETISKATVMMSVTEDKQHIYSMLICQTKIT